MTSSGESPQNMEHVLHVFRIFPERQRQTYVQRIFEYECERLPLLTIAKYHSFNGKPPRGLLSESCEPGADRLIHNYVERIFYLANNFPVRLEKLDERIDDFLDDLLMEGDMCQGALAIVRERWNRYMTSIKRRKRGLWYDDEGFLVTEEVSLTRELKQLVRDRMGLEERIEKIRNNHYDLVFARERLHEDEELWDLKKLFNNGYVKA